MSTTILIADAARLSNQRIEGPTLRQAVKMAARRHELIARSAVALAAGNDDLSFTLDCDAWDIEMDLQRHGFKVETGRPIR